MIEREEKVKKRTRFEIAFCVNIYLYPNNKIYACGFLHPTNKGKMGKKEKGTLIASFLSK